MIPVTYPSSVSTSKESQMVVFALPSVTGLQRWTDYIPVKLQATGADIANSFNTNGYLACDFLVTTTGKQAWIDYIPVFVDNAATTAWQVSETGFIPFNTLAGGGLYYLGPSLDLNFVGSLSNPLFASTAEDYTLNTNFLSLFYQVEAQYSVQGSTGIEQKNFADIVTFTRASTGTYFNSAGTLTTAAINEARFDFNPSTLAAQGLLIEESRTNSIRNNTMVGAVAGTPGTLPTNWSGGTTASGLARTIVGAGTENGISYIDVNYAGTTTAAISNSAIISPELSNQITAASGQTWTHSVYLKLQGGSFPASTTINVRISETDGTTILANSNTPTVPTSAALNTQRYAITRTLTNALTTFVQPAISLTAPISTAIDFTLRIGLPQLEQGAFATSVIPTTTTALTRSADVASVNTLSPWYNAVEGTLYAEWVARLGVDQTAFGLVAAGDGVRVRKNAANNYVFVVRDPTARDLTLVPSPALTEGQIIKVAGAYAANDIALSGGGQSPATGATYSAVTATTAFIGGNTTAGAAYVNGYLRRITYYPRRLSNADLQTITT